MPSDPPTPVSASYVVATRVLTVVFTGGLLAGATQPVLSLKVWPFEDERRDLIPLAVAVGSTLTATMTSGFAFDPGLPRVVYSGTWLTGTLGMPVAGFTIPVTVT